jgi:hypothetical protein
MAGIDPMWIWIGLGVLALLIVAGLFARGARRSRTASLRERFGNEYDHAVQAAGSRKRAEQDLLGRKQEVEKYPIRALTGDEQQRFRADWQKVEQHFIERPTTAVVEADELVAEIMRVRGYPMGDFEKHAAHLSVTHPSVVEHYRAGHRAISGAPGSASTEDLRQSMLHYRSLFDELIDDRIGNDVPADLPRAKEMPSREQLASREQALREDRDADFNRPR